MTHILYRQNCLYEKSKIADVEKIYPRYAHSMTNRLSRRDFLKLSALGLGSLALHPWKENWQEFVLDNKMKDKIDVLLSIIPGDVTSIVDMGCGNGLITNELQKQFDVVGIDRSLAALNFVNSTKVNGDINSLPLKNEAVDLLLASEVLEHLNDETLKKAIAEIQRTASKYILITVPNNELLAKNALK